MRPGSVRAQVAVAVGLIGLLVFSAVAWATPGVVRSVLEDDLVDTEAIDSWDRISFSALSFEAELAGLIDEEFLDSLSATTGEFGGFDVGALAERLDDVTLFDGAGGGFGGLDDYIDFDELGPLGDLDLGDLGDFFDTGPDTGLDTGLDEILDQFLPVFDPVEQARSAIDTLVAVDRLDDVLDAADADSFAVAVDLDRLLIVDTDGSVIEHDGDVFDVGLPVMSSDELDGYLFSDLGLLPIGSGVLVDPSQEEARVEVRAATLDDVTSFDEDRSGDVTMLVAVDVSPIDRSVASLGPFLWVAAPILALLVAGVAWLLVGRSLRPVRSITEQAATINSGTLDARVPVPATGDEIATLATTVNEMLDRIEADDRRRRQFVSDASHELRTPVAVMRNEAEVALAHPELADTEELATAVAEESTRLAAIIDDLLTIARRDERRAGGDGSDGAGGGLRAGVPASGLDEVDLDDVVLAEAARTRRVAVDTSGVSAARVRGRTDELGRMVGHLLDNAARHAESEVRVVLGTDGAEAVLHVDDDGPGVPVADRERIFDRFARLDEARTRDAGGAGLGLAVVAGTAAASGGTVDVGDATIGGARFTVRLPTAH